MILGLIAIVIFCISDCEAKKTSSDGPPIPKGDANGRPTKEDAREGAKWLLEQDRKRGR